MVKLDDYALNYLGREAENFKEDVQNIFNFGKYSAQVVGTPPTWTARNGEFVFFLSGTTKRLYFYNNDAWDFIEYQDINVQIINGWITFSGTGTVEITDNYNVASLTDNGTGDYTIEWDADFTNDTYCVLGAVRSDITGDEGVIAVNSQNAGDVRIFSYDNSGPQGTLDPADIARIYVAGLGQRA